MTRHRNRRDLNEAGIVAALEGAGCSVERLALPGCPDLLVGRSGVNYLLEVKDPGGARERGTGVKSATALTPDQVIWHARWKGGLKIVTSQLEALAAVGLLDATEFYGERRAKP